MSDPAATPSAQDAPASGGESALGSWAESGSSAPAASAPVESAAPAAGAPAPSQVADGSTAPPPPAAPVVEPFQLGGRTFESRAAADHWVRTTAGIGRAAQENRVALIEARQRIADLERAAQERERAVATPPASVKASEGQGQVPDPEKPMDAAELAQVYGVLVEKHGPVLAAQLLIEQMGKQHEHAATTRLTALEEKINKALAPVLEQHAQAQTIARVDGLINALSTYTTTGGRAAFPELQDAQAVREIGEIWADLEGDEETLTSFKGLIQAIALRRMSLNEQAATVSASAAQPVTQPNPLTSAHASSAAAVASASGDPPRSVPRPLSAQEQALADIRNAGAPKTRSVLGSWAE